MNNSNQPQNIAAIFCYTNDYTYNIQLRKPYYSNPPSEFLQINRSTSQMNVTKTFNKTGFQVKSYSSILGVVDILGEKFLLFCDECKRASYLQGMEVYEISSLSFLSYSQERKVKDKPNRKQIYQKIRDYYQLLSVGFYFSHQYNLTLTYPNQSIKTITQNFAWNRLLLQDFQKYQISFPWISPLIQGFVSCFEIFYQGVKVKYFLVSRRSTEKGGTRYFDRGVNDDGFVANYCETEQIVKIDEYCFSDLQIRGSLPIFFQQVGLYTKTKVNRSFELTHQAYKKHIESIMSTYKRVFMVNLLSMGKRGQKLLTEEIELHIKSEEHQQLKYLYYDFHHIVKGNNFDKVDEMIIALKKMKANLGYYLYDSKKERVISEQAGIFRTNCLDCLDRTNFFQAKLALITLQTIFKQLNISQSNLLDEMKSNQQNMFIRKFRNIWADNGDAISYHYTGTGSTHTDITRDGKRGFLGNFKHKYKSVTRFYNQNFWDFYKMKIVSLLLGNDKYSTKSDANKLLKERQKEYTSVDRIQIYIFTWKAPKIAPKSVGSFPKDVDLIVANVQDLSETEKWIQAIDASVDKQKYVLAETQNAYHNLLRIYVRRDLKSRISSVQQGKLKFKSYYNTLISNKSANIIRLCVDNSRIVFAGCQLEKGQQYFEGRIKNLREIHQYAFQIEEVGVKKTENILFDDSIFLIGNMNTTISSNFKQQFPYLSKVKKIDQTADDVIQRMLATDQFQQVRTNLLEYRDYDQEPIHFLPTYKYVNGAFDPQISGWPDRIWFSSEGKVKCLSYGVLEDLRQEHVPVVGRYLVEVLHIDDKEKDKISKEIIGAEQSRGELGVGDLFEEQEQPAHIAF